MITGELKSKVDRIWDTMWSGGISNPRSVIEQLTYLAEPILESFLTIAYSHGMEPK